MTVNNAFVHPRLTLNNLDRYVIRQSIFNFIKEHLNCFKGVVIDVGCGAMPYKTYICSNTSLKAYLGVDIETAKVYKPDIKPDYLWDGHTLPFQSGYADTILLTEVLEHCPQPEAVIEEVFRVLQKGGILIGTVPFLWPLHEVPHDNCRFTPFALKRMLIQAGFSNTQIIPHGGWHQALAAMLGLWLNRGVGNKQIKKILSLPVLAVMKILIKKDKKPTNFSEGQMCLGFGIIAVK